MKWLKAAVDFLIETSIWVALSVLSLTYTVFFFLELSIDFKVLSLNFFATIFGYNFVKFFQTQQLYCVSIRSLQDQFMALSAKQRLNLTISLLSGFIAFGCFLQLKIKTQIFLFAPLVLTYFYSNPLQHKSLRSTNGVKIFVIALCWVGTVLGVPILELETGCSKTICVLGIRYFCFVIAITLPFEIRDCKTDPTYLKTIPQVIGVRNSKFIGLVLLLLFFMLGTDEFLSVTGFVFVLSSILLLVARVNQGLYYAAFWVEGIPVLWAVLLLIV